MKLKKLIAIFLLTTLFVTQLSWTNFSSSVYVAEGNSITFRTSIEKANPAQTILHPEDEFEVNLRIGNFQNIEKGLIVFSGQLEYDTNILEKIVMKQESQWNKININEANSKFVADTDDYVTEGGNVFTIKFKVKGGINVPTKTTIAIKNVMASNGIMDIISNDVQLELTIEMPKLSDSITSEKYVIENEQELISRIPPKTTVSLFKQNIEAVGSLVFTDKNGKVLGENDLVATGTQLQVGDTLHFTLVVTGDIDGSGDINITDLAQLKLHYIEKERLTGILLKAADVDGKDGITITDLAQVKLVLVGKTEIK